MLEKIEIIWKKTKAFLGFRENEYGDSEFVFLPFNWFLAILILILLTTTWFKVGPKEAATIRIFGAYTQTVGSGLNFKLPWPISEATITEVNKIHRMELGFRTVDDGPPAEYEAVKTESEMLTGDEIIANVEWIIQYKTYDAYKWQFRVVEPEKLLNDLAQASMRLIVGKTSFDSLATSGKTKVEQENIELLQSLCDEIDFGVKIIQCNLQDVDPPKEAKFDYADVLNAKEDKQKAIEKAKKYYNERVPEARGKAAQRINKAKGYASKIIDQAKGEAKKYLASYNEYRRNKMLTKMRMKFKSRRRIISGSDIVINKAKDPVLQHFDLINRPENNSK